MGNACDNPVQHSNIWVDNAEVDYNQFKAKFKETLKIPEWNIDQKIIPNRLARTIQNKNIKLQDNNKKYIFDYPYAGYISKHVSQQDQKDQKENLDEQIFDGKIAAVYLFDPQFKEAIGFYYGKLINHRALDQKGLYVFDNGDYYQGHISNNKANGHGQFVIQKQISLIYKYEGQWQNNLPQGHGTQQTEDYIYTGNFQKGKKQGKGQLKYKKGEVTYIGQFSNNNFQGEGVLKKNQKEIFKGKFKNGTQNGNGFWFGQNDETYEGNFQNGKKNGAGKYTFSDKTVYEGEFKNGFLHGKGKIINGQQIKQGVWMQNKNIIIFNS